ncbi:unnamed protein product [Brassica rapa]|uniref:Uncharacterized protein n=1 Tax=Brassica campestris TaxID=3711 RepID=M4E591_BRACM|nr:unnamed protein product [Brassica rapa]
MDLETENQIASVLLREAAELRRQAEKDGVRAYLGKPNVRHRPNSRFLTATVLGVKQSNRAVETNEMWKARELENERLKRKSREESSRSSSQMKRSSSFSKRILDKRCSSINDERKITQQSSSDKRLYLDDDDEGLGDDEIESFLQSRCICLFAIASVTFSFLHLLSLFVNDRNKRGRGSVGPRMDETGPYLPTEKVDQLQNWYSTYVSSRVTGSPNRPHVVFIDGHCTTQLEESWTGLFSGIRYATNFTKPLCFRHTILSPLGYETALFNGLSGEIDCN